MNLAFFDAFSVSGMMPHGFCIKWTPGLLWSYVISDALITLAYFTIAVTLAYFVTHRNDLKFRSIYLMFSAFILACGTSHLMSIILIWQPFYWLDAIIKVLTVITSVAAAGLLIRLMPIALKLPSHRQLQAEITARNKIQSELQTSENRLIALSQKLMSLIEAIPDAILFKDDEGRLLIVNEHAKHLFRLNDVEWQGKTYYELACRQSGMLEMHTRFFLNEDSVWRAGHLIMLEDQIINDEGRLIDIEIRKKPIFHDNGQPKAMVVICRDVSNIRQAESQLRIAEAAIETQEGIMITDKDNFILRVNKAFTRLTGYQPKDVVGKQPSILKSGRHSQEFYRNMWATLKREKFWQGEVWDRRKNGEIYPKWLTINAVTGADGRACNYVAAFTDISQHKEAQAAIHRLAFYDPLTDLPNRRLLQDRLQQCLNNCSRHHQYGAILMIDVDHFKTINDTMGHHIGDQLLIHIAKQLEQCVRLGDTVARLGGDEFVILLENLGSEERMALVHVEEIAQKILNAVNTNVQLNDREHHNSISIGISMFNEQNNSFDDTLKRADAALYQAKDAGRNTLRFFDPNMQALMESRLMLESDLRHALELNQLSLHYQAQQGKYDHIFGAEVLLRWTHPQRGSVSPAEFIPIAEETGLILPIGYWILQTVCEQLKIWAEYPIRQNLHLAVNVSARQFRQADFVERVSEIVVNTGADPTKLKLELTESLVLDNVTDTIEKMYKLKQFGIQFSMDDFGTGYSCLSYLKKLPLSQLKIDQSFVRDIIVDPNDAIIAQTIIGMGHNLGLNVIAEGVETQEQRQCLEIIGCDAFQGYLFSRPLPLLEFEQLAIQTNENIKSAINTSDV